MIQRQVKLILTPRQERRLNRWLWHLSGVWNWAVKKIEHDAASSVYYTPMSFTNILNGHGAKIGVAQDAINGTLRTAHQSWQRCFKKSARKPHLKGRRNRLNSIAFAHGTKIQNGRLHIQSFGKARFHKQDVPEGRIGQFRLVRRASGWYACLFIHAEPIAISVTSENAIGVDSGFSSLLTLSSGEKIEHPRELEAAALRLAQSQRGNNQRLTARLQERIANRRKDRNHKLSRRLVSENALIAFSADKHLFIAKHFGKSVASSGHYQLRQMLSYKSKCRTDGLGVYVEVDSRNSTKTCSGCGALSGPTGLAGLKVRLWTCTACGAEHDRDVNAAINTLIVGARLAHERLARVA